MNSCPHPNQTVCSEIRFIIEMSKWLAVVLVLAIASTVLAGCQADIRPAVLTDGSSAADSEARGRELLEQAFQAAGGPQLESFTRAEVEMTDRWQGFVGRLANPWPAREVRIVMDLGLGTRTARARFIEPEPGRIWGVEADVPYEVIPGEPLDRDPDDNRRFLVRAIQYFLEYTARSREHSYVRYAGPEVIDGQSYERVYGTWGDGDPNDAFDQYVSYINPTTGRIEKIFYTVRDAAGFATGAIHFEDFRTIQGVSVPFLMSVTFEPDEEPEDYVHRMTVHRAKFSHAPPPARVTELGEDPSGS